MTAARDPAPPTDPPKPRPPRRRRVDGDVFGSFTPWKNPAAVCSYVVALFALVPVLGLLLGPIAVVLGLVGFVRFRMRPEVLGANFAVAGIMLGSMNTILNGLGIWCVGRGAGWW